MKSLKYFIPLIIFLGLVIFFWLGLGKNPNLLPSALLDKPLPVFTAEVLEIPPNPPFSKEEINQSNLKGQVSLLNVWATWCIPCRQEHSALMKIAQEKVVIYGLNYKDNSEQAKQWLKDLGNPYQMVMIDKDGGIAIDLGVYGVPETYIIDKDGIIRYRFVGVLTYEIWTNELKPIIEKLNEKN